MAAGQLVPLVAFWKEWGILALVLMSFSLQVILLITAEIHRRKDSGVLKVVIWSAYLMADTTAIYVLGHLSVTTMTSQEHELRAFWAPFLLLHLGGQDNITAYSIEDNRLWLRHLQSFVVQVLAATYVLYQSSIVARPTLLRPAAILMFVVGVVKYGERVCALKLACGGSMSPKNYHNFVYPETTRTGPRLARRKGKFSQAFRAHELLNLAKKVMKGPRSSGPVYCPPGSINYEWEFMVGVAEMQLSLMHDVFYRKYELIHTFHGYCIRVFALLATVAALLQFCRFSEKDGYRRTDVATTYVLLAGAVALEITSVLRAMSSSWAYGRVIYGNPCFSCCNPVLGCISFWSRPLAYLNSAMCGGSVSARYWSGSMGQHNFIDMWSHCHDSRGSNIARLMGREDWWNMLVYTSSIPVSPDLSRILKEQVKASMMVDNEHPDHIHNSRGRAALKRKPGLYQALNWSLDKELDKSILIWHMGTHIYLSWYKAEHAGRPHHLAQVTQELSNYMMFLLATRPYMLSGSASRIGYVKLCYAMMFYRIYTSEVDLLKSMRAFEDGTGPSNGEDEGGMRNETFRWACRLGKQLISIEMETPGAKMLELISQVWVELLCYAACQCAPDSHARQLSNGGEFITIVALMLTYRERGFLRFYEEHEEVQDIHVVSTAGSTTALGAEDV